MNKKTDLIGIIGLLLAVFTLIFGDNIYEGITGQSIFEPLPSPTATSMSTTTLTQLPPTVTPSLIPTPDLIIPTITPIVVPSSPTNTQDENCFKTQFIADVTVPDNTVVSQGQEFLKTWRIKNAGSCTWGDGYKVIYVYGEKMSGQAHVLPGSVMPGQLVDISVQFTAPAGKGKYISGWQMTNINGTTFGNAFFVKIDVE
jgi:hypothetical protein